MRKRIGFILALLAVFVLVMSGCASDSVDNQSSSSKDSVDVNVFQFKVEFKDQFEELVELYMKENEHVNLSVQTVGGGSDYAASLKAEMASGNEPVIFNIGGPTELNEYRDYLADLSDTQAATLALDGTLNGIEEVKKSRITIRT